MAERDMLLELQRAFAEAHTEAEAARAEVVAATERYRKLGSREGDARKALHAYVEREAMSDLALRSRAKESDHV